MRDDHAPGLEWRPRRGGRVPLWVAPAEARKQGYTPPTVRLAAEPIAGAPDATQALAFAAT